MTDANGIMSVHADGESAHMFLVKTIFISLFFFFSLAHLIFFSPVVCFPFLSIVQLILILWILLLLLSVGIFCASLELYSPFMLPNKQLQSVVTYCSKMVI